MTPRKPASNLEPDIFEVHARYKKAVALADVLSVSGLRAAQLPAVTAELWKRIAEVAHVVPPRSEATILVVKELLERREALIQQKENHAPGWTLLFTTPSKKATPTKQKTARKR